MNIPTDNQQIQEHLIRLRLLDPPADGVFGPLSQAALGIFKASVGIQEPDINQQVRQKLAEAEPTKLNLGDNFASRVVKYMIYKKYFVACGHLTFNIIYVEGCDYAGKPNNDIPDQWNDRRLIVSVPDNGVPNLHGNWDATTEPGRFFTKKPMNPRGAARVKFGQYKSWRIGFHGNADSEPHEALIQVAPIDVYRDANQDFKRTNDKIESGLFGINQHWGYDYDLETIGRASAGCLVGRSRSGHKKFMSIIKTDRRFRLNPNYTFITTIIPGDDLNNLFPT